MRKMLAFLLVAIHLFVLTPAAFASRCTGSSHCGACTTCSSCKHCNRDGGSCGVCRGKGGGWFKWLVIGGVAVYGISALASKRKNK